jgi:hypothetical protein
VRWENKKIFLRRWMMITVELHGFEAEVEDDGRLGPLQDPVRNNRMPTAAELRDYAEFIRLVADIIELRKAQ